MVQEPMIDLAQLMNFVDRHAAFERVSQVPWPIRVRHRQLRPNLVSIRLLIGSPQIFTVAAKTKATNFQTTQSLLERFFKGTTDGHRFTDGLHLSHQR